LARKSTRRSRTRDRTDATYRYFAIKAAIEGLASSGEMDAGLQLLLGLAVDALEPAGGVVLFREADEAFVGAVSAGKPAVLPGTVQVLPGDAYDSLAAGRPFVVRQPRSAADAGIAGVPVKGSVAAVPLVFRNELLGAMVLWQRGSGSISDRAIEHAGVLAQIAGALIAMEKTGLLARTDELTGVQNYRALAELLGARARRRQDNPFSVIMLELDDLRHLNNVHGHQAGNRALKHLSDILRQNARANDYVTRFGGDEFVILLSGAGKESALQAASRFRSAISKAPFELGQTQPAGRLTVSMGVASFPEDGSSPEEVLQKADEAMYNSKIDGKDRITAYAEGITTMTGEYQGRKILGAVEPVTGLYDKTYMLEQLAFQVRLARHFDRPLSLLILDVDAMERVNNEYGGSTGDHVLREIALMVVKAHGDASFVCKSQGDEIAVIMPGAAPAQAMELAERIRLEVESEDFYAGGAKSGTKAQGPVRITVSVGVAGFPRHATSSQDLLLKAQLALERAKQLGANRCLEYSSEMRAADESSR
jgi:diguanylate cyclase (GGDEF)-like protein